MNSKELINSAKKRFEEMKDKNLDWTSFYTGYLQGYVAQKQNNKEIL